MINSNLDQHRPFFSGILMSDITIEEDKESAKTKSIFPLVVFCCYSKAGVIFTFRHASLKYVKAGHRKSEQAGSWSALQLEKKQPNYTI